MELKNKPTVMLPRTTLRKTSEKTKIMSVIPIVSSNARTVVTIDRVIRLAEMLRMRSPINWLKTPIRRMRKIISIPKTVSFGMASSPMYNYIKGKDLNKTPIIMATDKIRAI